MRKMMTVIISILLILGCLCSCKAEGTKTSEADNKKENYREHQELTAFQTSFDADNMLRVSIPEANLNNVFIRETSANELLDNDIYGQVYLLADDRYGGNRGTSDHYLVVVTNDKIVVEDLSKWEDQACYSGNIELCDFDGDGDKEILLHECVGMTGGAGQYLSRVFNFDDNKLVEMFCSDNGTNDFNTGFSIKILKDRKFVIENEITKYSEQFRLEDRKDDYFDSWYDKNGDPVEQEILVDSFYEFSPVDIDKDGVYEIVGRQYVSLIGHSDGIGSATTVLKFNNEASKFEIIETSFSLEF
ncbi:MAG: hypothetical protein IIW79_01690 [Clostridia bacterium]|nr:hypothetical protein [Clostridia bacterium]